MKFIFQVRIKPGCTAEQYIMAWQNGSAIIQEQPGAKGTKLHKKIGEEDTYLAIASWESKEARDRAMENLKKVDQKTRVTLDRHRQFGDVTLIGSFEDSEWEVGNT